METGRLVQSFAVVAPSGEDGGIAGKYFVTFYKLEDNVFLTSLDTLCTECLGSE